MKNQTDNNATTFQPIPADPDQHLMAIAQIVQNKYFEQHWLKAKNTEDLRNLMLITTRLRKGKV